MSDEKNNQPEQIDLGTVLQKGGLKLTDLIEWAPKIHGFLDLAKSKMHILQMWEETLNLKPTQKLIYSFVPMYAPVLPSEATEEQIKENAKNSELFICVQVMEQDAKGNTVITAEKFILKAFENAESLLSLIPKDV